MLTKKLYPALWIGAMAASFALGAFCANTISAAPIPRERLERSLEAEPASESASIVSFSPSLEPKELIRGGLAQAYAEREPNVTMSARSEALPVHSDERVEQMLARFGAAGTGVEVSSEPIRIRGGLAEEAAVAPAVPKVTKPVYAPHSDEWTASYLDRFVSPDVVNHDPSEQPGKVRGGPLGD